MLAAALSRAGGGGGGDSEDRDGGGGRRSGPPSRSRSPEAGRSRSPASLSAEEAWDDDLDPAAAVGDGRAGHGGGGAGAGSGGGGGGASVGSGGAGEAERLERGEVVLVAGTDGSYRVKRVAEGYSCTCPGWRFNVQRKTVAGNSCKHIRQVRGDAAEDARLATAPAPLPRAGGGGGGGRSGDGVRVGTSNSSIAKKVALAKEWLPPGQSGGVDPAGWLMSEKLDGMRAYWSGGGLWSRNGKAVVAPPWFLAGLPASMELDGELWLGRGRFQDCMSAVRSGASGGRDGGWRGVCYVVFDAPQQPGGLMARLAVARTALPGAVGLSASGDALVRILEQTECRGLDHLTEELARVEALGGEGLMLRKALAAHRGGRTSDILKVKKFKDDEAIVTGYEDGHGKHTGAIGSLICRLRNGVEFRVGSGLKDSERVRGSCPAAVGSVITFKYFELTRDGAPRFPTFLRIRPDVGPEEFH